jgi:hypothetical protein
MTFEKGDLCAVSEVIAEAVRLIGISQDIRFYIAELKSAQKCATADSVDMRHCTFPNTSPML